MAILDGGRMFKAIRKLSNFLGLGIPDKIDELFIPKEPTKKALKVPRQGSSQAIPVVYGTQIVGGITVHKYVTDSATFSTNKSANRFLHLIVVFCEGQVDGLDELYFNGVKSTDKRYSHKNGQPWFVTEFMDGSEFQNSALAEANIPNWTASHRLQGLCWMYIGIQQDKPRLTVFVTISFIS